MAKLELALLVGEESKQFLVGLTKQLDRLEALADTIEKTVETKAGVPPLTDDEEIEVETDEDEDDDFAKKPAKKKAKEPAKKSFDEDDEDEETDNDADDSNDTDSADVDGDDSDDDEDEEVPAPKKGKAKKVTPDDCNDAAKALAASIGGKPGREKVLTLMEKHFKTRTISDLKPDQYEAFVKLMKSKTK